MTSSAGTLRLLPAQESYPSCCPTFSFQLESFFSPGPEKYHQLLITESSRSDLLISHSLSGWEHDCTQEQSPDSLGYFCQVSPGASSLSLSFFFHMALHYCNTQDCFRISWGYFFAFLNIFLEVKCINVPFPSPTQIFLLAWSCDSFLLANADISYRGINSEWGARQAQGSTCG